MKQSTPSDSSSLRLVLILYSHLRLNLLTGLFPLGFPTRMPYILLISSMRSTFPAHLILLHQIILIICGDDFKLSLSTSCSFISLLSLRPFSSRFTKQFRLLTLKIEYFFRKPFYCNWNLFQETVLVFCYLRLMNRNTRIYFKDSYVICNYY